MIDFSSSDDLEIGVADELEVTSNICRYDIIVIEKVGPGRFIMRALGEDMIEDYFGNKYLVDKGKMPGSIKLTQFK